MYSDHKDLSGQERKRYENLIRELWDVSIASEDLQAESKHMLSYCNLIFPFLAKPQKCPSGWKSKQTSKREGCQG